MDLPIALFLMINVIGSNDVRMIELGQRALLVPAGAYVREVCAIASHGGLRRSSLAQHPGFPFEHGTRRLIRHSNAEDHPTLLHAPIVA